MIVNMSPALCFHLPAEGSGFDSSLRAFWSCDFLLQPNKNKHIKLIGDCKLPLGEVCVCVCCGED